MDENECHTSNTQSQVMSPTIVLVAALGALIVLAAAFVRVQLRRSAQVYVSTQEEGVAGRTIQLIPWQGVYKMRLHIGGSAVNAVVDTGSSRLLVSSSCCKSCDSIRGGAVTTTCRPEQTCQPVQFGSQKDCVEWLDMRVCLGHDDSECTRIQVGAVHERSGDSNLNVAGMSPTVGRSALVRSFAQAYGSVVTIHLRPSPWFSLLYTPKSSVSILSFSNSVDEGMMRVGNFKPSPGSGADLCADVADGTALLNGKSLPNIRMACYDTGSNIVSFPSRLQDKLVVKSTSNKLSIHGVDFSPFSKGAVMYHDAPVDADLVIVGSPALMNVRMSFDLRDETLHFSPWTA